MVSKLVIVESPAKARTISRFLGDDYDVLASVGHIRLKFCEHLFHFFCCEFEIMIDIHFVTNGVWGFAK